MTDHHAKSRLNGHIAGSLLFLCLALAGWGAFLYALQSTDSLRSEMSSRIDKLEADRDRAVAERDQWRAAHDRQQGLERELTTAKAELEAARAEIVTLTQAQEKARTDLEAARGEVATLTEQVEQANARVQETGGVSRSSRRPARRRGTR